MKGKRSGIAMVVIGLFGLCFVYSMRPPSGIGEALMMLGEGRQAFIQEPLYEILLAITGGLTILGAFKIYKAQKVNKVDGNDKES